VGLVRRFFEKFIKALLSVVKIFFTQDSVKRDRDIIIIVVINIYLSAVSTKTYLISVQCTKS